MQPLSCGGALGATGYRYQLFCNDTGTAADFTRAALEADSLNARFFGAGPLITYMDELFGKPTGLKLRCITEFDTKWRFENDMIWLSMNLPF
jgi:hypothetical protein